uniref:Uncharacterized protein n=1 Tax=Nelumbo nucifera TaxID=4432 RepID=A0A822Y8H4_NELNU|nr:TPA_asm: hypothetical protein HUJ06_029339 [Nelumbo nucifera]
MKEANMLKKQMDALIAFRIKVENPTLSDGSADMARLASDVANSASAVTASIPSSARDSSSKIWHLQSL